MENRRDFLKKSVLVAGGLLIGNSDNAFASTTCFPVGVFYTKENPGKWAKKVKGHAPEVMVEGKKITIVTNHGMFKMHYIVRHTLISADGQVIGEKTFFPTDPKPVSTFELPAGAGSKFYATSFCNLHDYWVAEFTI